MSAYSEESTSTNCGVWLFKVITWPHYLCLFRSRTGGHTARRSNQTANFMQRDSTSKRTEIPITHKMTKVHLNAF